jgi:hypothetical protein
MKPQAHATMPVESINNNLFLCCLNAFNISLPALHCHFFSKVANVRALDKAKNEADLDGGKKHSVFWL